MTLTRAEALELWQEIEELRRDDDSDEPLFDVKLRAMTGDSSTGYVRLYGIAIYPPHPIADSDAPTDRLARLFHEVLLRDEWRSLPSSMAVKDGRLAYLRIGA